MAEIIKLRTDGKRVITLTGEFAIGKSILARHVCMHLQDRDAFNDGIIEIEMQRRKMTVDNLVTQLYKKIMVEEGLKGSNSSNHKA